MTARCACACHGVRLFQPLPSISDPIAALSCCDLCRKLHAGVWTLYTRPRITKRHDAQADGNTDSEGPEA